MLATRLKKLQATMFVPVWAMPLLLATALILALSGCAKMTAIGATKATTTDVCKVWQYIKWSVKDTDETIEQAKVNNARRKGFCKD